MASYDYSGHQVPERAHFKNQAHPEEDYGYSEDDYRDPAPRGGGFSRIVNFLGATASLALVAGVVVWGYQLIVRDVSGVPVVRAAEGPMRIQPENPGGTPADHQGLAVNTVAAVGSAAAPADRLILAPKPVSLSDEDAPMGQLQAEEAQKELEAAEARLADDLRQAAVDGAVTEAEGLSITDPVEIPGLQLASLATPEEEPAIDPADLAAQLPDPELAALPGVRRSLRPQTRPARVISRRATTSSATEDAINAAVKAAVGLDVDPNALSKGTRLAQVGAYESVDVAQAEWDRLNNRFGEFMNGKQRVIQKTSSGGRTFYRLRVMGFDDLSDSRQFCAALVAQGADCIPVSVR